MSKQYDYPVTIIPLSQADGGGFAAYVYDLPGCMSDGETAQEAYTNAQDAIECWIEGAQENGMAVPDVGGPT